MIRRILPVCILLFCMVSMSFAEKKKDENANTRTLQGVVTDTENNPIAGAVVQLKELKSLQIRSFITKDGGSYQFTGLNTNADYEVKAEYQGSSSDTKTLSNFNTQKKPVIDLRIKSKK